VSKLTPRHVEKGDAGGKPAPDPAADLEGLPDSFRLSVPSLDAAPGEDASARLAFELASNLKSRKAIAEDFGMTEQELRVRLDRDQQLRQQYKQMRAFWTSPTNLVDRVRVKSGIMVEDSLPMLWNLMRDPKTPVDTRLKVHQHMAKLADLEPRRSMAEGGEGSDGPRFSLTLNFGNGEEAYVVPRKPALGPIEDAA
jgi:hypothetical protein